MKTAYYNGIINTISQGIIEAFVEENGIIIFTGTNEDCLRISDTQVDLNNNYVLPGFNDSHMHLLGYGRYLANVQLHETKSIKEIQMQLMKRLNNNSKWIIGRGFNDDYFYVPGLPSKNDLDYISKSRPICITRCCGHLLVCNSKAIELANVTKNTTIEGGKFDLDKGIFYESAMELIYNAIDSEDEDQITDYIKVAQKELNRYGITSISSDDFMTLSNDYQRPLNVFQRMSLNNELTIRITEQAQFKDLKSFKKFIDVDKDNIKQNDYFKIGPLKLLQDGSLGAKTAALTNGYIDDLNNHGVTIYTENELDEFIKLAYTNNMAVCTHVIGDKALDMVLDSYGKFIDKSNQLNYGLVHVQITRLDQLQRIADMHLHCYIQSIFIDYDSKILNQRVDENLAKISYAFKRLYDTTTISNGSDCPVEFPNVLKGIQLAITRESIDGYGTMNKNEALSLEEALKTFTINGAIANRQNYNIGSLEEGKFADFIVLSNDISKTDIYKIKDISVLKTYINGLLVYEK